MNAPVLTSAPASRPDTVKIVVAFVVLFALYHAAEYFILFQNHAAGFLGGQVLFFIAALLLGTWCRKKGLGAWGLPFSGRVWKPLLTGVLLGVALYAVPYSVSLLFGIEQVVKVPDGVSILKAGLPFAFGVLFSSFSEDVLTRGIPYAYFGKRIGVYTLVLLSAVVYVLNHIYRLGDGPAALLYLFLLGVVYMIPVVYTGNLWLTGGMHWAGNVFFFVTHSVIRTEEGNGHFSYNYLFATWLVLCIPLIWLFCKGMDARLRLQPA
jgi:membrane protease YdiL (CAAX protease family)